MHLDPCPVQPSQPHSFQSPLNEVANPFSQMGPLPPSQPLVQTPATSHTALAENLPIQTPNLLPLHPYYSSSPLDTSTPHPSFESPSDSNGDIQYSPSIPLTLVPYSLFPAAPFSFTSNLKPSGSTYRKPHPAFSL
ncbi:hypothetical protein AMTRI_Chr10g226580 [Amborella trichopoda]